MDQLSTSPLQILTKHEFRKFAAASTFLQNVTLCASRAASVTRLGHFKILSVTNSVTRLGEFGKYLPTNFLTKVA